MIHTYIYTKLQIRPQWACPRSGILAARGCVSRPCNSNSHGARPVHQIIAMIKWIRTSRLGPDLDGRVPGMVSSPHADVCPVLRDR